VHAAKQVSFPRRGDVWWGRPDPVVGSKIGKTRPVLVMSNDQNNEFSDTINVLPITSSPPKRRYHYEVILPEGVAGLETVSRVKANMVRTIDKARLVRFIGVLPGDFMPDVEQSLRVHFGMY